AALVRAGRISAEEAYSHPWRNRILQALGGTPDIVVEMYSVELRVGDRLMIASDDLTDELRDAVIREILALNEDPEAAGRMLIERAKEAGGRDNITVALVDVTADLEARTRRERAWALLNRPVSLRRSH